MSDEASGQAHTAHTSCPVPLIYLGSQRIDLQYRGGILSDIAPTLLAIMKLPQPEEMTGKSLLKDA